MNFIPSFNLSALRPRFERGGLPFFSTSGRDPSGAPLERGRFTPGSWKSIFGPRSRDTQQPWTGASKGVRCVMEEEEEERSRENEGKEGP